jgi:hypothetical protein
VTDQESRPTGLVEWLAITIDCADPAPMATFYATKDSAFVRAAGLRFVFRAVPTHRPPTWPAPDIPLQSHFEFVVQDSTEVARTIIDLGGSRAEPQPDDPDLVVMRDPAGHPFCLIRTGAATPF